MSDFFFSYFLKIIYFLCCMEYGLITIRMPGESKTLAFPTSNFNFQLGFSPSGFSKESTVRATPSSGWTSMGPTWWRRTPSTGPTALLTTWTATTPAFKTKLPLSTWSRWPGRSFRAESRSTCWGGADEWTCQVKTISIMTLVWETKSRRRLWPWLSLHCK